MTEWSAHRTGNAVVPGSSPTVTASAICFLVILRTDPCKLSQLVASYTVTAVFFNPVMSGR